MDHEAKAFNRLVQMCAACMAGDVGFTWATLSGAVDLYAHTFDKSRHEVIIDIMARAATY